MRPRQDVVVQLARHRLVFHVAPLQDAEHTVIDRQGRSRSAARSPGIVLVLDDNTVNEIAQTYSAAFAVSSPNERASVREHLEILECAFERTGSEALSGQLRKLRDQLAN